MRTVNEKNSHPTELVVRASKKIYISNYNKLRDSNKRTRGPLTESDAHNYFSNRIEKFHPRRSGQATGLCPFHNDRHPSFSVNLKTGEYLCFSCGERGKSIVSFHSKHEGITFPEAAKQLEVTYA